MRGVIEPTDLGWARIAPDVVAGDLTAVVDQVHLSARGNRGLRIDPRGEAYVSAKLREVAPRFGHVGNVAAVSLDGVWHGSRALAELRALPASNEWFDAIDVRALVPAVGGRSPAHRVALDLAPAVGGAVAARSAGAGPGRV